MPELAKHILTTFESSLTALRDQVLDMAQKTATSVRNAKDGLFREDDDLCNSTIADDEEIDQQEKEVDRIGLDVLMRFQPLASDLRQVIAAMRVCNNLERAADQAVSIAKKTRKLSHPPDADIRGLLSPLFDSATELLLDAVKAYQSGDLGLARSLKQRDREVDELNRQAAEFLITRMAERRESIADDVNLLFIARHLERVGDHAKNIAEDVVYAFAAEDIRHVHAPIGV
ncbi:MAG TPA: phosphate signaling complex protein PhoU [Chthoniobacteraceae bacterium]|jgi:phosphate transport system protein